MCHRPFQEERDHSGSGLSDFCLFKAFLPMPYFQNLPVLLSAPCAHALGLFKSRAVTLMRFMADSGVEGQKAGCFFLFPQVKENLEC